MTKASVRLFFFCFVAVMNFVPLCFVSAQETRQWFVWRRTGECSISRQDWLAVSQQSPGYGWQICNGSTAHFTFASAAAEMDALKIMQCNADTPNCPRFQNDCCESNIWENTTTGSVTIAENSPGFGWRLSPLNSPTQCCEEAAVAIGFPGGCRDLNLVSVPGATVRFTGNGQFRSLGGTITIPTNPPVIVPSVRNPGNSPQPPPGIQVTPEDSGADSPWGTGEDEDFPCIGCDFPEDQPNQQTPKTPNTPATPKSGAGCSATDAEAFSNMSGSWHWYRMNVTIGGSCDKATGSFVVREWCEGVDEPETDKNGNPIPRAPKVQGTFEGKMEGGSLQVEWAQPASPNHQAEKGTGSCSLGSDGLSCRGFGCSGSLTKQ